MNDRQRDLIKHLKKYPYVLNEDAMKSVLDLIDSLEEEFDSLEEELVRVKEKSSGRRIAVRNLNKSLASWQQTARILINDKMRLFSLNQELMRKLKKEERTTIRLRTEKRRVVDVLTSIGNLCVTLDSQYCNGIEHNICEVTSNIEDMIDKVRDIT